jgi:hypothetical protein
MLGAVIGDIVGSIYEKKRESAASQAIIDASGTITSRDALGHDHRTYQSVRKMRGEGHGARMARAFSLRQISGRGFANSRLSGKVRDRQGYWGA